MIGKETNHVADSLLTMNNNGLLGRYNATLFAASTMKAMMRSWDTLLKNAKV